MKPKRVRGTTIGLYFAGMTKNQTNEIRGKLNEIAFSLGYMARGPGKGKMGNAPAMLVAIAQGELEVVRKGNQDGD